MAEIIDLSDSPVDTGHSHCRTALLALFPDICPVYLEQIISDHAYNPELAVDFILDLPRQGKTYETVQKASKRKRQPTPPEPENKMAALHNKYTDGVHRKMPHDFVYIEFA